MKEDNYKNIKLSTRFENYESDAPDYLQTVVFSQLESDNKKRKRRFIIYFLATMAVFAAGWGIYTTKNNPKNNAKNIPQTEASSFVIGDKNKHINEEEGSKNVDLSKIDTIKLVNTQQFEVKNTPSVSLPNNKKAVVNNDTKTQSSEKAVKSTPSVSLPNNKKAVVNNETKTQSSEKAVKSTPSVFLPNNKKAVVNNDIKTQSSEKAVKNTPSVFLPNNEVAVVNNDIKTQSIEKAVENSPSEFVKIENSLLDLLPLKVTNYLSSESATLPSFSAYKVTKTEIKRQAHIKMGLTTLISARTVTLPPRTDSYVTQVVPVKAFDKTRFNIQLNIDRYQPIGKRLGIETGLFALFTQVNAQYSVHEGAYTTLFVDETYQRVTNTRYLNQNSIQLGLKNSLAFEFNRFLKIKSGFEIQYDFKHQLGNVYWTSGLSKQFTIRQRYFSIEPILRFGLIDNWDTYKRIKLRQNQMGLQFNYVF
jgi:hypothetical protein